MKVYINIINVEGKRKGVQNNLTRFFFLLVDIAFTKIVIGLFITL